MRPSNYASGGAHRVKEQINLHPTVTAFTLPENPQLHLSAMARPTRYQVKSEPSALPPDPFSLGRSLG